MIPSTSTVTLIRLKGKEKNISSRNNSRRKPATPMEPKHNRFSMDSPFSTNGSPYF
jgi:hypothetical protein